MAYTITVAVLTVLVVGLFTPTLIRQRWRSGWDGAWVFVYSFALSGGVPLVAAIYGISLGWNPDPGLFDAGFNELSIRDQIPLVCNVFAIPIFVAIILPVVSIPFLARRRHDDPVS